MKIVYPKVSIVIPVYNGVNFLSEAIESAISQSYQNIEIIVVNDGSNDSGRTERVALSYGEKIRYFYKKNGGVASALNLAIKKMKGEYFSWLSHDDIYYPDKVESQVQALIDLKNPKIILYGDCALFSSNANNLIEKKLPIITAKQFRYFLTVENILHGCTLLVPKSAFIECGAFNEKLRTTQDYDLWFRLAKNYQFIHNSKLLVKARQHPEQGSIKNSQIALAECDNLLTGFVKSLSHNEILESTNSSICLSYARISANMQCRGFRNAAKCALKLSYKSLNQASTWDIFKTIFLVLRVKYVYVLIFILHKVLFLLKSKVKKCLE